MKKVIRKGFVLAVSAVVIMLIAGCEEQQLQNAKKSRLIAAENMQLKKELERLSSDIEELKKLHGKEIEKQQEQLAKCQEEKETWKEKSRQNIRNQVNSVLDAIMKKNAKLRKENKKLKAQVEQLEAQAQQPEKKVEEQPAAQPKPLE